MRISIITVCLNSVKTIEKTIRSVISQGIENLEYIIIDGGSNDGTVDVIRNYSNYITYWVSEPDSGIYNAMNKGLKHATGDVIGILNSDDWYEDRTIKIVESTFINNHDVEVLFGNITLVDLEGNQKAHENPSFSTLWYQMSVTHPATFVKKDIYEKYGTFNEHYKIAADYELMYRFWKSKVNFAHIDCIFTYFRTIGVSSTSTRICQNETDEICKKNLNVNLIKKSLDLNGLRCNAPIYIWGIGKKGKFFLDFLNTAGIKVTGIFDNDKSKEGLMYDDVIIQRYGKYNSINDIQIIITIKDGYYDVKNEIENSCRLCKYQLFYYEDFLNTYGELIASDNGCLVEIDEV